MTLNEITSLLAAELGKELDIPTKLMLADRVGVWRSRLIRNSLDKDPNDRKFFIQTLYLPLVDDSETPECVEFKGCDTRSTKIPKPLRANNTLFDYVGSVTGNNPFSLTTTPFLKYKGKYSKNKRATYVNDRLRVYDAGNLPKIRIDGVFDDPIAAADFMCEDPKQPCPDFWEMEYPVSGDVLQLILQSISQIDYARNFPHTRKGVPMYESPKQDNP